MTVIHIIKFVFKILLLIVLLPFILCWLFIEYANYKFVKSGMPGDMAKAIAQETKPSRMIDFGKIGIPKTDVGKVNEHKICIEVGFHLFSF